MGGTTDAFPCESKPLFRVLVVDDCDINREVLAENLVFFGMAVDFADNGLKALEKIMADRYNLIIMDVMMPVMDGVEATTEIRKIFSKSELPVIAFSADHSIENQERCYKSGMNVFLPKPIHIDSFYYILQQLFPSILTN